jgi:hypothetical protein
MPYFGEDASLDTKFTRMPSAQAAQAAQAAQEGMEILKSMTEDLSPATKEAIVFTVLGGLLVGAGVLLAANIMKSME